VNVYFFGVRTDAMDARDFGHHLFYSASDYAIVANPRTCIPWSGDELYDLAHVTPRVP